MAAEVRIRKELLDEFLAGPDAKTVFENDGLVDALKEALAERILNAELDHHLGQDDEQAAGSVRNGTSTKTVSCSESDLTDTVRSDRTVCHAESGHQLVSRGWAPSTRSRHWALSQAAVESDGR